VGELILNVLPYGLAAALAAPVVAVVTAMILSKSERPLLSALTFTAGAAALDVVYIVVLFALASASGAFETGSSTGGAIVDLVLGAIFLALGIKALFDHESPEKDAARRDRVDRAASAGLKGMLITGVVAQVINIDAMAVFAGAIKETAEANLSSAQSAIAILVALAVMLIPYYGPAVVYALSPARAGQGLRRMSEWLLGHSRGLEIVVGLGFGGAFLSKGLATI
jgi:threonine/homoserine/homoserine lactone efflux protein